MQLLFRYSLMVLVALGPTASYGLFRALAVDWRSVIVRVCSFDIVGWLLIPLLLIQAQVWTLLWMSPRSGLHVRSTPFFILAFFAATLAMRIAFECFLVIALQT